MGETMIKVDEAITPTAEGERMAEDRLKAFEAGTVLAPLILEAVDDDKMRNVLRSLLKEINELVQALRVERDYTAEPDLDFAAGTRDDLDYMVPIDTPEHITPDRLRFEAKSVAYAGRKDTARLIEWCADLIEKQRNTSRELRELIGEVK